MQLVINICMDRKSEFISQHSNTQRGRQTMEQFIKYNGIIRGITVKCKSVTLRATECNEVFLGDQLCQYVENPQRFEDTGS
jgi:hypothetical protein